MIQNEIKIELHELHSSLKPIKERKLSNASTFCSSKERESEEFKSDNVIKSIIYSRRNSNSYPKVNLMKNNNIFNNIFLLNINPKTHFKSKDDKKIKKKKKKIKEDEKQTKTLNKKNIEKSKNSNANKKKIFSTKNVNIDTGKLLELYTQNYDLTCMKKQPPKLPDIFYHEHNLNCTIKNETYGQINKGTIGNIFYSHLMTFNYKKKKLIKSCVTQRNQKKLLTIIYYKPNE